LLRTPETFSRTAITKKKAARNAALRNFSGTSGVVETADYCGVVGFGDDGFGVVPLEGLGPAGLAAAPAGAGAGTPDCVL